MGDAEDGQQVPYSQPTGLTEVQINGTRPRVTLRARATNRIHRGLHSSQYIYLHQIVATKVRRTPMYIRRSGS